MKIESEHKVINGDNATVFNYLNDLNNYDVLFPQDKIENWEATEDQCSCKIKGLSDIGLKKVASTPNTLIYLDSFGKSPIKFTLNIYLSATDDNKTNAHLIFDGNINPFMKMMLEKPLTTIFNNIVVRLEKKFS
jgi:hypothetical protein